MNIIDELSWRGAVNQMTDEAGLRKLTQEKSVSLYCGVDPTGVCVPTAYDALDPARAGRSLAGWVSADEAGLARWITHYCAGVVYGAQVGRDVARHVQAGRLS